MAAEQLKAVTCEVCSVSLPTWAKYDEHRFEKHEYPEMLTNDPEMLEKYQKSVYIHKITCECSTHGKTIGVCIHPSVNPKEAELIIDCLTCRYLKNRQATGV